MSEPVVISPYTDRILVSTKVTAPEKRWVIKRIPVSSFSTSAKLRECNLLAEVIPIKISRSPDIPILPFIEMVLIII